MQLSIVMIQAAVILKSRDILKLLVKNFTTTSDLSNYPLLDLAVYLKDDASLNILINNGFRFSGYSYFNNWSFAVLIAAFRNNLSFLEYVKKEVIALNDYVDFDDLSFMRLLTMAIAETKSSNSLKLLTRLGLDAEKVPLDILEVFKSSNNKTLLKILETKRTISTCVTNNTEYVELDIKKLIYREDNRGLNKILSAVNKENLFYANIIIDAIEIGNYTTVKALLVKGFIPGSKELFRAIEYDYSDIVKLLIEFGAKDNVREKEHWFGSGYNVGDSAVYAAITKQNYSMLKTLISSGFTMPEQFDSHIAWLRIKPEIFNEFVKSIPKDKLADRISEILLKVSSYGDFNLRLIKKLLVLGARSNIVDRYDETSTLINAAKHWQLNTVRELLKYKCDVTLKAKLNNYNALDYTFFEFPTNTNTYKNFPIFLKGNEIYKYFNIKNSDNNTKIRMLLENAGLKKTNLTT